jgi:hypothetical protein
MKQQLVNPQVLRELDLPPLDIRTFPELQDNSFAGKLRRKLGLVKREKDFPGTHGFVTAKVRHFLGINPETGEKMYDDWNQLKSWIPGYGWNFWKHNLVTDVGEDYIIAQIWTNAVAGGVGINFMALSTALLSPVASDTVLSGEITSGVNAGLARILAPTRTHTAGANTATISNTFTSSGAVGAPGIQSSALMNAISSGTMGHIQNLPSASGAMSTSDQISVSWLMTSARP